MPSPLKVTRTIPSPLLAKIAGYKRKLWNNRIEWKVQLNVRNLFDDRDRIPQRVTSAGATAVFTIPAQRTFILSNSFRF